VRIEITQLSGDGAIRRAHVETTERYDAERWERLAEDASLDYPPPYRPDPGQPVYEIQIGARVAQVGERDLVGPLRELVTAVMADGAAPALGGVGVGVSGALGRLHDRRDDVDAWVRHALLRAAAWGRLRPPRQERLSLPPVSGAGRPAAPHGERGRPDA
jgi:hypothetical protein